MEQVLTSDTLDMDERSTLTITKTKDNKALTNYLYSQETHFELLKNILSFSTIQKPLSLYVLLQQLQNQLLKVKIKKGQEKVKTRAYKQNQDQQQTSEYIQVDGVIQKQYDDGKQLQNNTTQSEKDLIIQNFQNKNKKKNKNKLPEGQNNHSEKLINDNFKLSSSLNCVKNIYEQHNYQLQILPNLCGVFLTQQNRNKSRSKVQSNIQYQIQQQNNHIYNINYSNYKCILSKELAIVNTQSHTLSQLLLKISQYRRKSAIIREKIRNRKYNIECLYTKKSSMKQYLVHLGNMNNILNNKLRPLTTIQKRTVGLTSSSDGVQNYIKQGKSSFQQEEQQERMRKLQQLIMKYQYSPYISLPKALINQLYLIIKNRLSHKLKTSLMSLTMAKVLQLLHEYVPKLIMVVHKRESQEGKQAQTINEQLSLSLLTENLLNLSINFKPSSYQCVDSLSSAHVLTQYEELLQEHYITASLTKLPSPITLGQFLKVSSMMQFSPLTRRIYHNLKYLWFQLYKIGLSIIYNTFKPILSIHKQGLSGCQQENNKSNTNRSHQSKKQKHQAKKASSKKIQKVQGQQSMPLDGLRLKQNYGQIGQTLKSIKDMLVCFQPKYNWVYQYLRSKHKCLHHRLESTSPINRAEIYFQQQLLYQTHQSYEPSFCISLINCLFNNVLNHQAFMIQKKLSEFLFFSFVRNQNNIRLLEILKKLIMGEEQSEEMSESINKSSCQINTEAKKSMKSSQTIKIKQKQQSSIDKSIDKGKQKQKKQADKKSQSNNKDFHNKKHQLQKQSQQSIPPYSSFKHNHQLDKRQSQFMIIDEYDVNEVQYQQQFVSEYTQLSGVEFSVIEKSQINRVLVFENGLFEGGQQAQTDDANISILQSEIIKIISVLGVMEERGKRGSDRGGNNLGQLLGLAGCRFPGNSSSSNNRQRIASYLLNDTAKQFQSKHSVFLNQLLLNFTNMEQTIVDEQKQFQCILLKLIFQTLRNQSNLSFNQNLKTRLKCMDEAVSRNERVMSELKVKVGRIRRNTSVQSDDTNKIYTDSIYTWRDIKETNATLIKTNSPNQHSKHSTISPPKLQELADQLQQLLVQRYNQKNMQQETVFPIQIEQQIEGLIVKEDYVGRVKRLLREVVEGLIGRVRQFVCIIRRSQEQGRVQKEIAEASKSKETNLILEERVQLGVMVMRLIIMTEIFQFTADNGDSITAYEKQHPGTQQFPLKRSQFVVVQSQKGQTLSHEHRRSSRVEWTKDKSPSQQHGRSYHIQYRQQSVELAIEINTQLYMFVTQYLLAPHHHMTHFQHHQTHDTLSEKPPHHNDQSYTINDGCKIEKTSSQNSNSTQVKQDKIINKKEDKKDNKSKKAGKISSFMGSLISKISKKKSDPSSISSTNQSTFSQINNVSTQQQLSKVNEELNINGSRHYGSLVDVCSSYQRSSAQQQSDLNQNWLKSPYEQRHQLRHHHSHQHQHEHTSHKSQPKTIIKRHPLLLKDLLFTIHAIVLNLSQR